MYIELYSTLYQHKPVHATSLTISMRTILAFISAKLIWHNVVKLTYTL